jgi:hypothetical protein
MPDIQRYPSIAIFRPLIPKRSKYHAARISPPTAFIQQSPGFPASSPSTSSPHLHVEEGNAVEITTGGQFRNQGHISTGPSKRFKDNYNGISLNNAGGTVVNQGRVEGGSNGIKATDDVAALNTGELTGLKGAGVKSKGTALVINYGTITGADTQRPAQNDGDGDGLDIDKLALVRNHGIIQGTGANGKDKGGTPNTSEGIAMGGGEIHNYTRGIIRGAHHGVLVDNGDLGPAAEKTLVINDGQIIGRNGYGVKMIGDFKDRIINSGLISGANGIALDMGGGNDTLIIKHGSRFEGSVEGGSGTNQTLLDDAKGGHFNGANQMQHLRVASGTWSLTGPMDSNREGKVHSGASLINQSRIGGSMRVEPGATYAGGLVTNLDVAGTLQLDPSTRSQTRIKHDLQMEKGATLAFTVGPDQAHSTLKVGNNANVSAATLNIQVEQESDDLLTRQLRVVDAKQVEGQFDGITSNLKTLEPELIYTPTGVFIGFKRKAPSVA